MFVVADVLYRKCNTGLSCALICDRVVVPAHCSLIGWETKEKYPLHCVCMTHKKYTHIQIEYIIICILYIYAVQILIQVPILFYSIPFYSVLFYSIFHSILYYILFYILFYSLLLAENICLCWIVLNQHLCWHIKITWHIPSDRNHDHKNWALNLSTIDRVPIGPWIWLHWWCDSCGQWS